MKNQNVYLITLLSNYKSQLRCQEEEYKKLPEGRLGIRRAHGKVEYLHIVTKSESLIADEADSFNAKEGTAKGKSYNYTRKGITKNPELVQQLARKIYLETYMKLLIDEIGRLEKYLKKHIEPTPEKVLSALPYHFNHIPKSKFLTNNEDGHAWAEEKYDMNKYNPHEKIHITSRGLRVRSKSELIIAERLYAHNIPFRYEQMLYVENQKLSPDFTININGNLYYWEHCGLMNDAYYRNKNKWRLDYYERAGIVPWENLIVTYDALDGGINLAIIESEIVNKLCP